jgi:hypothetical protein
MIYLLKALAPPTGFLEKWGVHVPMVLLTNVMVDEYFCSCPPVIFDLLVGNLSGLSYFNNRTLVCFAEPRKRIGDH